MKGNAVAEFWIAANTEVLPPAPCPLSPVPVRWDGGGGSGGGATP